MNPPDAPPRTMPERVWVAKLMPGRSHNVREAWPFEAINTTEYLRADGETIKALRAALAQAEAQRDALVVQAVEAAVQTLAARVAELEGALRELRDVTDGVDNGYCTLCHGHRLYNFKGQAYPSLCDNRECLSRRLDTALGLTAALTGGENA